MSPDIVVARIVAMGTAAVILRCFGNLFVGSAVDGSSVLWIAVPFAVHPSGLCMAYLSLMLGPGVLRENVFMRHWQLTPMFVNIWRLLACTGFAIDIFSIYVVTDHNDVSNTGACMITAAACLTTLATFRCEKLAREMIQRCEYLIRVKTSIYKMVSARIALCPAS